jgi:ATP-binding cassette, subfamily C, bacterial LapB
MVTFSMTKNNPVRKQTQWDVSENDTLNDDPLLNSLEVLAKLHGRSFSRTAICAGLPLIHNRLTVELFPRAAERIGFSSRIIKRPLDQFSELELPAVLLLKGRKAIILTHTDNEQNIFTILLPESRHGERTISQENLHKQYTGHAIFIRPKFRQKRQHASDTINREKNWFWGTLFSSWRIYRDVFIASFLINVFGLATPCFILNVYDRVIPNAAFETLWVLAIGIGIIYLFELLMRGLRGYFVDEAGKKSNLQMSSILFEKVMGLRMEVRPKSVGAFTKNLQQFESIRDFITSFSITALIDLPFVAIGLLAIWYIAGNMVWIQIVCIVILIIYAFFIQISLKKAVSKSFHASAQKNAILVEGLTGIETIKMSGAEGHIQRALEEAVSYIATWSARSRFLSSSVTHLSHFIQSAAVVAVVITGVYMISQGNLSQGALIACVILSRRAIAPMTQVVSLATRFHRARNSLQTLNKIMALPSERPPGKTFIHRAAYQGSITVTKLNFSYPDQNLAALKDINFHINPGEKVGIIGPIGSGKTTLGKLLLGLYEPSSGMVAMDGTDIHQIDPSDLRSFIGYIPQDIMLFRGTIRDNIILGTRDMSNDAIIRAATISGVADFVKKNPLGYDMQVGEQGRNLSGGQRQSVAMARAILRNPPILLMDEPTSSMDNRNESKIKSHLLDILNKKTLIIITHRASLLDLVDRILVIDNETIVADGTRTRILEALQNGQLTI